MGTKPDPTKDVRLALVALGFTSGQARAAIAQACAHVGEGWTPEQLLREALGHCAR